ncbi:hypothetical protein Tco_0579736, partial [Tanacetum coccineum]
DHSSGWMEVEEEEEEAIKMIQKLQKLLEFQMNLLVVEEEVADEVETQVVFSVKHVVGTRLITSLHNPKPESKKLERERLEM